MSLETPERYEPVSHVDAAWLRMDSHENPMVINSVLLFDGVVPYEIMERLVAERLLRHARFQQRVKDRGLPLRPPRWQMVSPLDLRLHLHHVRVPAPGDRAAFEALLSDLVSTPLPKDRPLWQAYLIDDVEGGSALLVRIHHAVGDGVALVKVLRALADKTSSEPTHVGLHERRPTSGRAAVRRAAEQGTTLGRLLLLPTDPPTVLNGTLGARKRVTWSEPIPLEDVHRMAHALGGTVNDVLQAGVAGTVHRYLERRGDLPHDRELRTMVTVFMRDREQNGGNHFSLVFLDLPVKERDALARFHEVKRRMDKLKSSQDATVAFAVLDVIGIASPRLEHMALSLFTRKATSITTNVPGPTEALHFAGHRLRTLLVWAPTSGHLGLGFTLLSYAGEVRLGVFCDAQRVVAPEELAFGFREELAELERSLSL